MKNKSVYYVLLILSVLLCGACVPDRTMGKKQLPAQTQPSSSPKPAVTPQPSLPTEAAATPQPSLPTEAAATPQPTVTPSATPFVVEESVTLMDTYGTVFDYSGTCIAHAVDLQDEQTMALIKEHYNSITLENESKPDFILGSTPELLTVEEAKARGYKIPDSYEESMVPGLDFSNVDLAMKLSAENELGMRFHTLVWHSQTPGWFFRENYSPDGELVTSGVMDARMEFYIRSVMTHVYDSEYSRCVYAWDVVNEYLNADDTNWIAIYGEKNLTPDFVKKAYEIADDVLCEYGIRDRVSLIFNDYNTYMNSKKLLSLMEFLNSEKKICDGIGMQAHLDVGYPATSLFKSTAKKFLEAGCEVQITELDVSCKDEKTQGNYYYQLMKGLLELKKEGGNLTGITYWGMSDSQSWRGTLNPLLFSVPGEKKTAYYRVLQAYTDAGYLIENVR